MASYVPRYDFVYATAPSGAAVDDEFEFRGTHLAGDAVWIGAGLSVTAMVAWVPRHKAAAALVGIAETLAGRMPVGRYRKLVGLLADLLTATGGGARIE